MIEMLLSPGIGHAETFGNLPDALLFPEEEIVVAGAGAERRGEFATARHLARQVLAGLEIDPVPLLPGPRREPSWPAGVVGSITHCAGYRAVVAAERTAFAALGIDAEPNSPMPAGLLRRIATPQEDVWITKLLTVRPAVAWDRLLFSIKESVYKAWYPLTRQTLGFHDSVVTVDVGEGTFVAQLRVSGADPHRSDRPAAFHGRWLADRGLLITAVHIRPDSAGAVRQPLHRHRPGGFMEHRHARGRREAASS